MPDRKSKQIHLNASEGLDAPLLSAGAGVFPESDTGAGIMVDLEAGQIDTAAVAPCEIELAVIGARASSAAPAPTVVSSDFFQLPEKLLRNGLFPFLEYEDFLAVRAVSKAGKEEVSHRAIELDESYKNEARLTMPRDELRLVAAFGNNSVFRKKRDLGARNLLVTFTPEDLKQVPRPVLKAMLKELRRPEAGALAHQNRVLFETIYKELEKTMQEDRKKMKNLDCKGHAWGACGLACFVILLVVGIGVSAVNKPAGISVICFSGMLAVGTFVKKCCYTLKAEEVFLQREKEDGEFMRELQDMINRAEVVPLGGTSHATPMPSVASMTVQLVPWSEVHREAVARGQIPATDHAADVPTFSGRLP